MGATLLNPAQQEAVEHIHGPVVVFAGAGSGKTRVITHRIANLVDRQNVAPWRILAVTFTNKAAQEMRERVGSMLPDVGHQLQVGTFHSTCARLLRYHHEEFGLARDFTIYDDQDQNALLKRVIKGLGLDDKAFHPKKMGHAIQAAKRELISPDEYEGGDFFEDKIRLIYAEYEKHLRSANAFDFSDLIGWPVLKMEENEALRKQVAGRFDFLLVDEFQDTNLAQLRLVRALAKEHRNLMVVGDDDQSIYSWRGADRRNILNFRETFPDAKVIKLEQNYRSTKRVLRAAYGVISKNLDREPKELFTDNDDGAPILVIPTDNERDEADLVVRVAKELQIEGLPLSEMAVFYRIHAQSRVIEEALRRHAIPYRIIGGMRFYERAEIKDALAYLRVLSNKQDDVSLLRIINTPTRGIGKTTIEKILNCATQMGEGVWAAIEKMLEEETLGKATLKKVAAFVELIEGLRAKVNSLALSELAAAVLSESGYFDALRAQGSVESEAKEQNLQELVGSIQEQEGGEEKLGLAEFLESVALDTNRDENADEGICMMTVHAAKGLEFPTVMVVGMEEEMFPFRGVNPWEDPSELEEERRLAYVAITRAEERLFLSYARTRRLFRDMKMNRPSRFLSDMPEEDVNWVGGRVKKRQARSFASQRSYSTLSNPHAESSYAGVSYSDVESSTNPESLRVGNVEFDMPPSIDDDVGDESYVDYSDGDFAPTFRPGLRVKHKKFGVGRIRDVAFGQRTTLTVIFEGFGTKKLAAEYVRVIGG